MKKYLFLLILSLILVPTSSFADVCTEEESVCSQEEMMEHMYEGGGNFMHFGDFGFSPGFFGFGFVFTIIFWGLIIWGIVVLIKKLTDDKEPAHSEKSPLDILKNRYAKGEIDKEEFEQKKKDLT